MDRATTYRIAAKIVCLWLCLLLPDSNILGQDIEEKINTIRSRMVQSPVIANGFIGISGQFNASDLDIARVPSLSGRLVTAISFDILGISAPFSMTLSTGGKAFHYSLPAYAFAGISPSYKWVKFHLGDRTMDLGKYTFQRLSFQGVGTELNPGKWRFKSFYGRLRRARAEDYSSIQRVEPFYRRLGWGMQGGYQSENDLFTISLFKAWDQHTSIPAPDSSFHLSAAENVVLGVNAQKQLRSKLYLHFEYAHSGYTEDQNHPHPSVRHGKPFAGLLGTNFSTRWGNAFTTELRYKIKSGNIHLGIERIDPGFKTMGALFFQNDLQNISVGTRLRLLRKKIFLQSRLGLQHNNLRSNQANDFRRLIGLIRLGCQINDNLNIEAGYSSFNHVNRRSAILDPVNPVPITDLILSNEDLQFAINWQLQSTPQKLTTIQGSVQYNRGQSILNDQIQKDADLKSLSTLVFFSSHFLPQKLNYGFSLNHQRNIFSNHKINSYSLGGNLGKQLWEDKLTINGHLALSRNDQSIENKAKISGNLFSSNLGGSWKISDSGVILVSSAFILNSTSPGLLQNEQFKEFRNTISYQLRF